MNNSVVFIAISMLALGLGSGYWLFGSDKSSIVPNAEKKQPLFYRHPMNPAVTSPVPAKGSMGMDYVPVYN